MTYRHRHSNRILMSIYIQIIHKIKLLKSLIAASVLVCFFAPHVVAQNKPWRLADALGTGDELKLSGAYRVRYEHINNPFRSGLFGEDEILVERLSLAAEYKPGAFYIGAELQDSRAQLADNQTPIGTDDVNAFELLKGYIGYQTKNVFNQKDTFDISAGRLTLNIGSRRLAARNGYRNTVNSFLGINSNWQSGSGQKIQAFATLPTRRFPNDTASLLDNKVVFDKEDFGTVFWGIHYTDQQVFTDLVLEAYIFGLNEQDLSTRQTANRNIYTPGFRLRRGPSANSLDFEVEVIYQFGRSSLSNAPTAPLLDHSAYTYHTQVGYSFGDAWQTRLSFQYDAASGDTDPFDNKNGRFDRLFGIPAFEFGPTGLYGLLARTNLRTPGARISLRPTPKLDAYLAYRLASLDSARDALTTAGLQDTSGASGSKIGNQFEGRVRYQLVPGNVQLAFGGAYLNKGRFLRTAPGTGNARDAVYFYTHILFSF